MDNLDRFGRRITYLRVSVTDRCNFRCIYCMPPQGVPWRPHREILRYEEIVRIVEAAASLGVRKVRLTGGEPLVRKGLPGLVRELAGIPGIEEVVLTTNGSLLAEQAAALARAGLARVNVSLDSLRPERFHRITRLGRLEDVWAGIRAARAAGLVPIRLNAVVLRGVNENEVVDITALARQGFQVRFIEWMPLGSVGMEFRERFVPGEEIRARVEEGLGPLTPLREEGPARVYALPDGGEVGFITAFSAPFCATCNRMRITADGKLRPCLLSPLELDLREPLRSGATREELAALLAQGIERKPFAHGVAAETPHDREMSEIGG
ncbi:GTP 3',8-cyclase MoaA [Candidatus Acetothermia bacterium]|nr:MAG: GTP 3',8-cyclase MoaA [Candidatus Acetothermia bacterium]